MSSSDNIDDLDVKINKIDNKLKKIKDDWNRIDKLEDELKNLKQQRCAAREEGHSYSHEPCSPNSCAMYNDCCILKCDDCFYETNCSKCCRRRS